MGNTVYRKLKEARRTQSVPNDSSLPRPSEYELDFLKSQRQSLSAKKFSRHVTMSSSSIMSAHRRNLLKDSWTEVMQKCGKDPVVPGIKIYKRVFDRCPELRQLVGITPLDRMEQLRVNHPFLRHARVFTNIIDLMVRNVEELDQQIAPALITYGRRHYYKHGVGFTPAYITVFAEAMIGVVLETIAEKCTDETKAAWELLVEYMVKKMKQGYQLEVMHARSKRPRLL